MDHTCVIARHSSHCAGQILDTCAAVATADRKPSRTMGGSISAVQRHFTHLCWGFLAPLSSIISCIVLHMIYDLFKTKPRFKTDCDSP